MCFCTFNVTKILLHLKSNVATECEPIREKEEIFSEKKGYFWGKKSHFYKKVADLCYTFKSVSFRKMPFFIYLKGQSHEI